MKLHFCGVNNSFHCIVSRDEERNHIDFETIVSPVEIKYSKENKTSKFFVFLHFSKPCSVNISSSITILQDRIFHSVKPEEPSRGRQYDDDPKSKYYHLNLINELEKLDILPPGMAIEDWTVSKNHLAKERNPGIQFKSSFKLQENKRTQNQRYETGLL